MKTLVIVKPGAAQHDNIVSAAITRFNRRGLSVTALAVRRFTEDEARSFYAEHEGKDFFNPLVEYMTSGPSVFLEVSSKDKNRDVVRDVREILGATDPAKAKRDTLRRRFGQDIRHNAFHGSDSEKSAERELGLIFGK